MPQIQILPAAPGFGSQLGQALGSGFSQGITSALSQYLENKQQNKESLIVSEALKDIDPESSNPYEVAAKIMALPIRDKSKQMYGTIATLGFRENRENRLQTQGVYDQYRRAISELNAEIKDTPFAKDKKPLIEKRDKLKKEFSLNHRRMREGQQPVFDVYESLGVEEEPEGNLSEQSHKPQQTTMQAPDTQKPKRKLTEQVARHYLKQANGDVNAAKKMAFDQGFE